MELLIRINSHNSGNPALDAKRMERGHVIAAKPDGWPWSVREINHSDWAIIRSPITQVEAESLTAKQTDIVAIVNNPSRRKNKLDLTALGVVSGTQIQVFAHTTLAAYTHLSHAI